MPVYIRISGCGGAAATIVCSDLQLALQTGHHHSRDSRKTHDLLSSKMTVDMRFAAD